MPKFLFYLLLAMATPAVAQDGLTFVDLTGEIDAFWERTRELPDAERAAAFRAEIGPRIPGFYDSTRAGLGTDADRYDRRIARGLANYPDQREGILEISRRFTEMFEPARRSFEERFGIVTSDRPVFLLHSFGELDGGMRELPDGTTLIFGTDMMARLHLEQSVQPLFHHELFHVLHVSLLDRASFGQCNAVWCRLWLEGLATYVSVVLNPEATDAELLLDFPEPIRPAVEANRHEAVCAVATRLDATDQDAMLALFSTSRMNDRLPPRFGYFIGYLAAERMAQTHDPRALAAMTAEEARLLLGQAIGELADCG